MSIFVSGEGFIFLFVEPFKISAFWFSPEDHSKFVFESVQTETLGEECNLIDVDLFKIQVLKLVQSIESKIDENILNAFLCIDGIKMGHDFFEIAKTFPQSKILQDKDLLDIKNKAISAIQSDNEFNSKSYPLGVYFNSFKLENTIRQTKLPVGLGVKNLETSVIVPFAEKLPIIQVTQALKDIKINVLHVTSSALIPALSFNTKNLDVFGDTNINIFVKINHFNSSFFTIRNESLQNVGNLNSGLRSIIGIISKELGIAISDAFKMFNIYLKTKNRLLPEYFYITESGESLALSRHSMQLIDSIIEEFFVDLQYELIEQSSLKNLQNVSFNLCILGEIGLLDLLDEACADVGIFKNISQENIGVILDSTLSNTGKEFCPLRPSLLSQFYKINERQDKGINKFVSFIIKRLL